MTLDENLDDYLPYRILRYYGIDSVIYSDNEMLYNQLLEDGLGYALYTQISTAPFYNLGTSLIAHPLKDKIFSSIGYIQNLDSVEKMSYIKLFCEHIS